jgi:hypothetical protein
MSKWTRPRCVGRTQREMGPNTQGDVRRARLLDEGSLRVGVRLRRNELAQNRVLECARAESSEPPKVTRSGI